MTSQKPNRKSIRLDPRVYAQPGTIALITVCTREKHPAFSNTAAAEAVVDEIRILHETHWQVLGYCVMPTHVHLLVGNRKGSLLDSMRLFKGRTAARLRKLGAESVWQRSFHDHILRRNEDIVETLKYLLNNPVRAGLTETWARYPWSGSFQWSEIDPEFFAINPSDFRWSEILGQD